MKKNRILIVDDSDFITALISEYFGEKFDINTVGNGEEALHFLRENGSVDLIVSDLNMPEMNGLQLQKMLKNSLIFRDIPFIILSSDGGTEKKIECLKSGVMDFVEKPFNPEELMVRCINIIKLSQK